MTIGVPMNGTRTKQGSAFEHPPSSKLDRANTRDLGLSKNVTASITFTASSKQLSGANGTFNNFAVNDDIEVLKTNLNNGVFRVTAIDGTNHAFLTVDYPVKDEGPLSATVRSV